jgi:hypothetical protein
MARKPLILKEGDACARGGVLAGQNTNSPIVCKKKRVFFDGQDYEAIWGAARTLLSVQFKR